MSEFESIEDELKFMADCSDDRGDSETSLMFVRYLAHIRKLNTELAALKAGQGEAVAWRDHSVNYAKGEKCPATIETLQAAWDRDQELLLDQKNVISKLKETINQLRQKRTTRPTATIQGEANRRPQTCNGRSCGWCKEGADPCHYTAPPATGVIVPTELLGRAIRQIELNTYFPFGEPQTPRDAENRRVTDELRARIAELEALINNPHTDDWFEGVRLEAAHQVERWGAPHDQGKTAVDWVFLIGHLATKAALAYLGGDETKAKHHTISTAAVCLNWFRAITGETTAMRPGIEEPK